MIKNDFDFVLKSLKNKNNEYRHAKPLLNLINNFKSKWDEILGEGVCYDYVNRLMKVHTNTFN